MGQWLQGQCGFHLGQRRGHHITSPGAVGRLRQTLALPGLSCGIERGDQVLGKSRTGAAGLHHLAQIVPGTHGKQRVGFTRRITNGGFGLDAQHMAGHLGVQLAHKRSAPELVQRVRGLSVAGAVNPVGSGFHFRAACSHGGHLLGQGQCQLAPHARVSGSGTGEDKCSLPGDGGFAKRHTFRHWASTLQPAPGLGTAACQFGSIRSHQHNAGRAVSGRLPGIQRRQSLRLIRTRKHMQAGGCIGQPRGHGAVLCALQTHAGRRGLQHRDRHFGSAFTKPRCGRCAKMWPCAMVQ